MDDNFLQLRAGYSLGVLGLWRLDLKLQTRLNLWEDGLGFFLSRTELLAWAAQLDDKLVLSRVLLRTRLDCFHP